MVFETGLFTKTVTLAELLAWCMKVLAFALNQTKLKNGYFQDNTKGETEGCSKDIVEMEDYLL